MSVELRWLERWVPRVRGIDNGFHQPPLPDTVLARVLQSRVSFEDLDMNMVWSRWADVPAVLETELQKEEGTAP